MYYIRIQYGGSAAGLGITPRQTRRQATQAADRLIASSGTPCRIVRTPIVHRIHAPNRYIDRVRIFLENRCAHRVTPTRPTSAPALAPVFRRGHRQRSRVLRVVRVRASRSLICVPLRCVVYRTCCARLGWVTYSTPLPTIGSDASSSIDRSIASLLHL